MKKLVLLAALLLPVMAYAQRDIPFTSSKPFNKGNFKIDASYSRMMQKVPFSDYPDFRVGVGYGITNWCVVGVFGSFGTHEGFVQIGSTVQDADTTYNQVLFEGTQIERYYHYGIDAELHPLTLLLPNFYFVDIYCRGELGMRTVTEQYIPDYDADYIDPVHNDFLIDGSLGVAINPSKYFGIFYEYAYDNLNKKTINYSTGTKKAQPIHRFGLNVRFPGPKKWQR